MGYCHKHGTHDGGAYGCPECRAAEEQAESDREETIEKLGEQTAAMREAAKASREAARAAREAAFLQNNPGDYACPSCKLQSLKWGASRCPMCQKDVDGDFWPQMRREEEAVRRREAEEKQREAEREAGRRKLEAEARRQAQEEWERNAPARLEAAAVERRRAEENTLAETRRRWLILMAKVYFFYLLPIGTWVFSMFVLGKSALVFKVDNLIAVLLPVLNWIPLVAGFFGEKAPGVRPVVLATAAVWMVFGLVIFSPLLFRKKPA